MASTVIATAAIRKVISGHGRFDENKLATTGATGRTKKPTFILPAGVTLTFYTPAGATLDNPVATLIEAGTAITLGGVEMLSENYRAKDLPTPYPYIYREGQEVIDYTVTSLGPKIEVKEDAHTVDEGTALREIVAKLKTQGFTDLHYACCSAGYSDRFKDLFPYKGYYVRLKSK